MEFDEAFELVIAHEGGYVSNPNDPGGETKYGISRRAYPTEDIKHLTIERAKQLYKRDYWDVCQCDQLPPWIRFHVFDAAVNSGTHRAGVWLQRAVGGMRDGIIGAHTIARTRAADPGTTIARFSGARLLFLTDTAVWPHFSRGWVRRIAANLLMMEQQR